jgi:quercetin dioxygenase-like cupin family protein
MQAGQVVAILAAMGGIGLAQTPPAANPGRSSSSAIENEYIRVVKVTQAPHQKTRPHQHTMNRIMLYLTAGSQVNEYEGGRKEVLNFKAGQPLWSAAGGVHVAEVTSEQPITIVEMELRKPSGRNPATTLDPLKVDPKHYKLEFENGQVRVFRVKIGPHEKVPLHEHVLNRVVVYLTGQSFRVTNADGKVDMQSHQAGDISWGEPARHQEENLTAQPFEVVVVELK